DPTNSKVELPPNGYSALLNGRDLAGWRELSSEPNRAALQGNSHPPQHWHTHEGILEHDGITGDLWTEREFADFTLRIDWRWPDTPKWETFTNSGNAEIIAPNDKPSIERILDAGENGILFRGSRKAKAMLSCSPVGSGEV